MINKLRKAVWLAVLLCSATGLTAGAQEITVNAKLERSSIRIGDQVKLHLSVLQQRGQQVTFPQLSDTLSAKIMVLSSSKSDTITDQAEPKKIIVTKSYVLTGFDAGSYQIPPFAFVSNQKDTLRSNEQRLDIAAVKVDTTKAIYDIKQPLQVSYTWVDWLKDNWYWVFFPLLVVLGTAAAIYYLLKRRKAKPVVAYVQPLIADDALALNKLQALREKQLWQQGEVKGYYSELTDVIREYLEKRYQIKTQEKTTDEIFEGLRPADITAAQKQLLYTLLSNADLVKFAKGNPAAAENEQSMTDAVQLILQTKKVAITEGGAKNEHI